MTTTTLIILILCIGVPIIIVSTILIFKGLKEGNSLLPLLASIMSLGFLFLYTIKNDSAHQENQYVYYVLIVGYGYELTHDRDKIKIFTTGLFGSGTEKIQFYTDDGQFIESNNFTYKKMMKDNNK